MVVKLQGFRRTHAFKHCPQIQNLDLLHFAPPPPPALCPPGLQMPYVKLSENNMAIKLQNKAWSFLYEL